jgi:uncharacterized membrane protein
MTERHPVVERYLTHLEGAIGELDPADRREVLQEIRNHIAEAAAAGKPIDAILGALGPADALGRAYAIELLLHPPKTRRAPASDRWLRILGLVVALSIPTLVVVTVLGSVGITFVASGLLVFVVGLLEMFRVQLPWVQTGRLPPVFFVVVGPVIAVIGLFALLGLRYYVSFVVRAVRSVRPTMSPADRAPQVSAGS